MTGQQRSVYKMIKTTEYVEDSGAITTYGVSCRAGDDTFSREPADDRIVPNISTRPSFVEELVRQLNDHSAAPIHLKDLIDDYLP
jgi:hypothetical protein